MAITMRALHLALQLVNELNIGDKSSAWIRLRSGEDTKEELKVHAIEIRYVLTSVVYYFSPAKMWIAECFIPTYISKEPANSEDRNFCCCIIEFEGLEYVLSSGFSILYELSAFKDAFSISNLVKL